jgi:hypothetical protein
LLPKQPSIHDFSGLVAAIGRHRVNTPQADQDPAEWFPPASDQYCRCIGEWIGTKLSRRQGRARALTTFADGPSEETGIDPQPVQ